MTIERISPPGVPRAAGTYSPAVRAGGFIYVSGQVPGGPGHRAVGSGDIRRETRQV